MFRAVMPIVCLFASFQSTGLVFAQADTNNAVSVSVSLADRLADAKHITLVTDPNLGGFNLHTFTTEQHQSNLEALATFRRQQDEWRARVASLDERLRAAQNRGASVDELDAINQARKGDQGPAYPLGGQPYDVVFIGADFIELSSPEFPDSTTLIPFAKICKVTTGEEMESRRRH